MSLCTTYDVSLYLGLSEDGDDALLAQLIASAQAMIERHTGRVFDVSADTTRYYSPIVDCKGPTLYLDREIAAAPTTVVNGDGATLAGTDYVTEPRNDPPYHALRLLASSGVGWTYTTDPEGAIAVTAKFGYSTTPPADVKHACIRLAAWLYRQRDNSADSDRPVATEVGVVLPSRIPADIQSILAPYVRHI